MNVKNFDEYFSNLFSSLVRLDEGYDERIPDLSCFPNVSSILKWVKSPEDEGRDGSMEMELCRSFIVPFLNEFLSEMTSLAVVANSVPYKKEYFADVSSSIKKMSFKRNDVNRRIDRYFSRPDFKNEVKVNDEMVRQYVDLAMTDCISFIGDVAKWWISMGDEYVQDLVSALSRGGEVYVRLLALDKTREMESRNQNGVEGNPDQEGDDYARGEEGGEGEDREEGEEGEEGDERKDDFSVIDIGDERDPDNSAYEDDRKDSEADQAADYLMRAAKQIGFRSEEIGDLIARINGIAVNVSRGRKSKAS